MTSNHIYSAPIEIIPTYLYIKQHSITGKLYFGKTSKPYPHVEHYLGSGKYWNDHIEKHSKEHVVTLWFCLFYDKESIVEFATTFCKIHNIGYGDTKTWSNLIPENGLDGASPGFISKLKGRKRNPFTTEWKDKISSTRKSSEKCRKTSIENLPKDCKGENNGMYGRYHTSESIDKIKHTKSLRTKEENLKTYSRKKSPEEIAKMKKAFKTRHIIRVCRLSDRRVFDLANYSKWLKRI